MTHDSTSSATRVAIIGATGRMGQYVVRAVLEQSDMTLAAAISRSQVGQDIGTVVGHAAPIGVVVSDHLADALARSQPDVVVDFTVPDSVFDNAKTSLAAGCHVVVGATGLTDSQREALHTLATQEQRGILIAPNFAIGAVLMIKFAQEASRYLTHAEIMEYHHNQKLDAPSGTALYTAEKMAEANPAFGSTNVQDSELLPGSRGGQAKGNVHIHSVRLPGFVASQEVVFGGLGQTLTLRHDSLDRSAFMPGVILAIRAIQARCGLVLGLETLLP